MHESSQFARPSQQSPGYPACFLLLNRIRPAGLSVANCCCRKRWIGQLGGESCLLSDTESESAEGFVLSDFPEIRAE